ncbi:MAG: hypothetical protein U0175_20965 [Caldilineaceae bacterium]
MNTGHIFTTSTRQAVVALLVATLLALSAVVAQNHLSALTGIGSASVAHACQGSGGTGAC